MMRGQIENNTPCVYAIGFRRSSMLEYIYHRHSIVYDPIYRVMITTNKEVFIFF